MGEPLSPQTQARHVFAAFPPSGGVFRDSQHIPPARQRPVQPPTKDITQALKLTLARQLGRHHKLKVTFKPTKSLSYPSLRP